MSSMHVSVNSMRIQCFPNQFQCTKLHFFSIQRIFFWYDDFVRALKICDLFYCCSLVASIRNYSIYLNQCVYKTMYTQTHIKLLLISFAALSYAISYRCSISRDSNPMFVCVCGFCRIASQFLYIELSFNKKNAIEREKKPTFALIK